MSQPVFDLHKLNQDLITANTEIVHLNAKIAHLNYALGLCSAILDSSNKRVEQLKEALLNLCGSMHPDKTDSDTFQAMLEATEVLEDTCMEGD